MKNIYVVVPSWNAQDILPMCLTSLRDQSQTHQAVVVDNGSIDDSIAVIKDLFPEVHIISLPKNAGFAGGVNAGISYALKQKAEAIALFNNDAVADPNWLKQLAETLQAKPKAGIVACKLMSGDKKHFDSTGDFYTIWGLPYPRGRDLIDTGQFDTVEEVFGGSGGASLYRARMFDDIGLFDEDFFAYFEDVDISFRAQLAGWKVLYEPSALVYHATGSTSSKIKGFSTYHSLKNYPMLLWKNVPASLLPSILPRFCIVYTSVLFNSLLHGRGWPALKGFGRMLTLLPKKTRQRHRIQKTRRVPASYIRSIIIHDLPLNAHKLRRLRSFFTK